MTDMPIRDASTVIILRDLDRAPSVLMGQRGQNAAFMPNKFVFPGGAVDEGDADIDLEHPVDQVTLDLLRQESAADLAFPLLAAAIRELWEETGLRLAHQHTKVPETPPENWTSFFTDGLAPSCQEMHFIFRAVTPPERPRRFDARFFFVRAEHVLGDLDDFSLASDELSHLSWVPLSEARELDLPFITEVVIAEVARIAKTGTIPREVPFFDNRGPQSAFLRLTRP